jgi:hypothetical protein
MSFHWINREGVRLGIMPRPRGNDWLSDDLRILRQAGVDVIVSALTALEAEELGLAAEAQECAQNGLLFISFPIEDRSVPTSRTDYWCAGQPITGTLKKRKGYRCSLPGGNRALVADSRLRAYSEWSFSRLCFPSHRGIQGLPSARHTGTAAMG